MRPDGRESHDRASRIILAGAGGQERPPVEIRAKAIPMRRVGMPGEIVGVVAFLASAEASYMTGQAINVTGGLWMT